MDKSRTELLLGEKSLKVLENSSIIVVGVGGVGGITAEMLVRTGVGNITLIDFDTISSSNINRQVIALEENVGKVKVLELAKRLKEINSSVNVVPIKERLTKENISKLITKADYIIDAIDSVKDKASLIEYAHINNIRIISAMGTANKVCAPVYEITDIFKTENDGLAKAMRKLLKEKGIKHHKVCYSKQEKLNVEGLGSVMWHPTASACVIVSEVIKDLIKESNLWKF